MKEPAIENFFSGYWPNYQTNYSSLNCFGGLILSGVGFGSFSSALLDLLKIISLNSIEKEFRIPNTEFSMISFSNTFLLARS
ncbi:MAG: hypothetical protein KME52_25185 [Desmonostoc geniculatum HA4340-LM1]|nr:hypothetical protein [Desmonostoc geniculatum HA4340-LM1]